MLEVKFNKKNKSYYLKDEKQIYNCEVFCSLDADNEDVFILVFKDKNDFDTVLKDKSILQSRIIRYVMESYVNWNGVNIDVEVSFEGIHNLTLSISFAASWGLEFDQQDYFTEFARIKGSSLFSTDLEFDVNDNSAIIEVSSYWQEDTIENFGRFELFEFDIQEVYKFHVEAIERLKYNSKYSISSSFNFPEALKIPCEQYLLYFAQFLQDLGINATSNLTEEAGKVLFSVTPTDDKEALDKIREALAVYLNLPSSPIVYDESFAAMRLKAEIERLQSSQRITEMEFRVTQKALESQDKIILQQSVLLEQQAKVIEKITSKSIMIDSLENKDEFEKIYEGIEITHSKWFFELTGIKANPITAMKTVGKKLLGKEDEGKSILGLDD
jgi:hypothetical protein